MAMTDDRIFVDGAGQKVPCTAPEAPNNGHRLRRRCIPASYRDSMSREGGMRVIQAAPRGTSWRVDGRMVASNRPSGWGAGRVTHFFTQTLACMHECIQSFRCPETQESNCRSAQIKMADSKRRSARPRWSWAMYMRLTPSLRSSSAPEGDSGAPECTLACMPEFE